MPTEDEKIQRIIEEQRHKEVVDLLKSIALSLADITEILLMQNKEKTDNGNG